MAKQGMNLERTKPVSTGTMAAGRSGQIKLRFQLQIGQLRRRADDPDDGQPDDDRPTASVKTLTTFARYDGTGGGPLPPE